MTVQIVPTAALYPQRCFFTGDPTLDRPLIDTGVEDTEGGRVYISMQFMDELARAGGYSTRAESEALLDANEELRRQNAVLPIALERAANAIRTLASDTVSDLLAGVPDGDVPVLAVRTEPVARPRKSAQGSTPAAVEQGRPRL